MSSLKHITLISDTGLLLFHTSFSVKEVDEVLISGFTGAIASIVDQLGDKLEVIVMQNQTFYLHPFENFIILLATETGLRNMLTSDLISLSILTISLLWEQKMIWKD